MNRTILVIDDEQSQAEQLKKALSNAIPDLTIECAYEENDIIDKILSFYYAIAIIDLRMDRFSIDGFKVIDKISVINPYAKIIAISAYTAEYYARLAEYMTKNKILAISEKEDWNNWIPKLKTIISDYFDNGINPITVQSLVDLYSDAKNETDTYKKGIKFENFVVVLFRQMGFKVIRQRVRDAANNETDLIVRNDINDCFFSKFKRYIYVECKNKPLEGFSKNDFIIFNNKVNSSCGDSDLGIVFTTGHIKNTVAKEALKESKFHTRIIYMSQPEIDRLIHTGDMLEEFKIIIDEQI